MSVFDQLYTEFVILERDPEGDGLGGYDGEWTEGERFCAYLAPMYHEEERAVGQRRVLVQTFHMFTKLGVDFGFMDRIKRLKDGAVFRTIGEVVSRQPPASAIPFTVTRCERWVEL